jgi:hypothetical protein
VRARLPTPVRTFQRALRMVAGSTLLRILAAEKMTAGMCCRVQLSLVKTSRTPLPSLCGYAMCEGIEIHIAGAHFLQAIVPHGGCRCECRIHISSLKQFALLLLVGVSATKLTCSTFGRRASVRLSGSIYSLKSLS